MTAQPLSPMERRNRLTGLLVIGGTLLVAAAALAKLVYAGTASGHEMHRNLAGVAGAVLPGATLFLLGCSFLIDPPGIEGAAPETLPWLQRPRVRRRLAYVYFALAAALILLVLIV